MKYLVAVAIAVAFSFAPVTLSAEPVGKSHKVDKAQPRRTAHAVPAPLPGNAAAEGNNANSMSGSNSAGDNANGRTGGGFN